MSQQTTSAIENSDSVHSEAETHNTGIYSLLMPVEPSIITRARQILQNKSARVDALSIIIVQDPVLTLELLRIANAMFHQQNHQPIATIEPAIVRMGSANVLALLEQVSIRRPIADIDVSKEFENIRLSARRVSLVSKVIAMGTHRDLADEAQTTGLMSCIGYMIACLHFGQKYVDLARQLSRASLVYRLTHAHHFDVRNVRKLYLEKNGFPEYYIAAFDRESSNKSLQQTHLRFIVESANELVEAYDSNRWDKYSPSKDLPLQSSLRLLQLGDRQYRTLYERAAEILERIQQGPETSVVSTTHIVSTEEPDAPITIRTVDRTHETISNRLDENDPRSVRQVGEPLADDEIEVLLGIQTSNANSIPTEEIALQAIVATEEAAFAVHNLSELVASKAEPRQSQSATSTITDEPLALPTLYTKGANQLLENLFLCCQEATSIDGLLNEILSLMTEEGPFERVAVLIVSDDRQTLKVHSCLGPDLEPGSLLRIDDPFSPFRGELSQIRSFSNGCVGHSNYLVNSGSFAISPLDIDATSPIILYADCGNDQPLTFESRRLFRYIVALLNDRIPHLPT